MIGQFGTAQRLVLAAAGVIGAIGVMSAAASSHGGESRNLAAMALICLSHAPALLALGLLNRTFRLLLVAALLMAAGVLSFTGDLALRQWFGHSLFPGAAPLAGVTMIAGWCGIILSAIISGRVRYNHI